MKEYLLFGFPLLTFASQNTVTGRTLQDCIQVASMFDNTCDSTETPIDLTTHAGLEVSCSGT